jgi:hypothetical protein
MLIHDLQQRAKNSQILGKSVAQKKNIKKEFRKIVANELKIKKVKKNSRIFMN